jgi:hypothetical protein
MRPIVLHRLPPINYIGNMIAIEITVTTPAPRHPQVTKAASAHTKNNTNGTHTGGLHLHDHHTPAAEDTTI